MVKLIRFDTIQAALDAQFGKGGWFFHGSDGSGTWFPCTVTADEALKKVKGTGYLASWCAMEARINGPIGGPRGR